jgi:hypothetical protein
MSNFIKFHGITLANNSWVENLHVERLASDPVPAQPGRIWMNTTTKRMKFSSLNDVGAVVVFDFAIPQDFTDTLNSAKAYTDQEVAALVASAPELLDTLKELADAIGGDANFATTVATQIANAKSEILGTVGTSLDTLGEIETAINTINGSDTTAGSFAKAILDASNTSNAVTDALDTRVTTVEGTLSTAVSDIAAETTRATTAEGVNAGAIAAETTARADADTAEATARIAGDATNATAVTAEQTARIAADGVLTTDIAAETTYCFALLW